MNQINNKPSELEMKLATNAIEALMQSMNIGMATKQLQEFKQQTIADAKAISNEWDVESCRLSDTEEN